MMKELFHYCSSPLLHLHFMEVMDSVVPGMVTDVLDTGTAEDHGTDSADVPGMDSDVAPGMAGLGGNS